VYYTYKWRGVIIALYKKVVLDLCSSHVHLRAIGKLCYSDTSRSLCTFAHCSSSPLSTPTKKFTPSGSKVRKRKRGREESTPDISQFHRMSNTVTCAVRLFIICTVFLLTLLHDVMKQSMSGKATKGLTCLKMLSDFRAVIMKIWREKL